MGFIIFVWIGDVTIRFHEDAQNYQQKIEKSLEQELNFKLKPGDKIVAHFNKFPDEPKRRKKRHSLDQGNTPFGEGMERKHSVSFSYSLLPKDQEVSLSYLIIFIYDIFSVFQWKALSSCSYCHHLGARIRKSRI